MRQFGKSSGFANNLDSLVDIVSNNLGILIILAAFMALLGLINPDDQSSSKAPQIPPLTPNRLKVPWSHPTNKNPVLFAIRRNRIVHLDMADFFRQLAKRPGGNRPRTVEVRQEGVSIRFFPVTNQVYCLEFRSQPNAGESWHQARLANSAWKKAALRYPPEKFYYFFWVSGDSFELFRNVRKALRDQQYEVGWKPSAANAPMEICNGFAGATGFQPQ